MTPRRGSLSRAVGMPDTRTLLPQGTVSVESAFHTPVGTLAFWHLCAINPEVEYAQVFFPEAHTKGPGQLLNRGSELWWEGRGKSWGTAPEGTVGLCWVESFFLGLTRNTRTL